MDAEVSFKDERIPNWYYLGATTEFISCFYELHKSNRKAYLMSYQKRSAKNTQNFNHGCNRNNHRRGSNKKYIDVNKFINNAVQKTEEVAYEPENSFDDFKFNKQLNFNITKKGYKAPSRIQDQAIPHILQGKDIIGLSNTGTGKTAAFLLPIIDRTLGNNLRPSVLIISPTRELAQQINEEFRIFSQNLNLYSALVVGGMPIEKQIRELKRNPHFIIGTPGRLKDLIKRRFVRLDLVSTLVLDEADRMLDMGFLPDIKAILSEISPNRQTLLFSATITPDIRSIIDNFTNDPITIKTITRETNDHIEQDVIRVGDKKQKIEVLTDMLKGDDFEKVLVFGETKFGVQRLSDYLSDVGITSIAIHGNKNQSQRSRALQQFKDGKFKVMVATDVAARGLDIPNVSHVINFDTPNNYEDYVHRIGRTGRGGATGFAYTFVENGISSKR